MITCINQEVTRHEISYYLPAYFIFLTPIYVPEQSVLKPLQYVFYRRRRGHISHQRKTNAKLTFYTSYTLNFRILEERQYDKSLRNEQQQSISRLHHSFTI